MTPTIWGRLQTRVWIAVTVGVVWTTAIAAALPRPAGVSAASAYRIAMEALGLMTLAGLGWELVYHLIQQVRWDKDWPSLFALITVINEAVPLWFLLHALQVIQGTTGLSSPALPFYASYVASTWLVIWLFMQGPIRVMHVRWRFEGGQLLTLEPGGLCRRMCDMAWRRHDQADDVRGPAEDTATVPQHTAPRDELARRSERPPGQELAEGIMCEHGHFSHPASRYCIVCGNQLRALGTERVRHTRPPVGILILDDGTTHILDQDVVLTATGVSGSFTFKPIGKRSRARGFARIRIPGWTPVACGVTEAIAVTFPGGYQVDTAPGTPVPLLPGAELLVCGQRVRFESPYRPAGPASSPEHVWTRRVMGN